MDDIYKGAIIKESLTNETLLNNLNTLDITVTDDENPEDRWHIHTVLMKKVDIFNLSNALKQEKYYMHFWNENHIIVIFPREIYEFNLDDKEGFKKAVEYGLSIGIPEEQLDFLID